MTKTKNELEQEPNFLEFIDEETNYQCFIFRNQSGKHADDFLPFLNTSGEYRNIEYVINECKKLAKQLKTYE